MTEFLEGDETQNLQRTFPSGSGRWGIHRSMFREGGLPHQLLVVTDLTRALREEELQAWQRLVRVLGHELNNSLAPIKSIAGSLETVGAARAVAGRLARRCQPRPVDHRFPQREAEPLSGRLRALGQAAAAAARAGGGGRLDPPGREPGTAADPGGACPDPKWTIQGDRDQLEQVLINLLRNAVDASLETGGGVAILERVGRREPDRCSKSRFKMKVRACRTPRICSCRSSPPSPAGRASGWCSAARSRKRTADRSICEIETSGPGCEARLFFPRDNLPPSSPRPSTGPISRMDHPQRRCCKAIRTSNTW